MNRKNIFLITCVLFSLVIILSLSLGSAHLSLQELINAIFNRKNSGMAGNIFWYARLPRTMACLLAGAGLSVSGLVIQNVLANKLASPSVIGVNAGAGFAVTLCLSFGFLGGWAVAGSAFIGALLAVSIVVGIGGRMNASRTTLILTGVAMNSFLNAGSEAIVTLVPEVGIMSGDFRVGGFTSITMNRLIPAAILICLGLCVLFTLVNELDIINLGEETAQGLGLSVKKIRILFLMIAALLAGASVSFAGLLGFVGLIVPQITRRLVDNESRYLLPYCSLLGATLITFCDLISRLIFQPYEIPVGILMAFIGGPFFIFLLLKSKGGHKRA